MYHTLTHMCECVMNNTQNDHYVIVSDVYVFSSVHTLYCLYAHEQMRAVI